MLRIDSAIYLVNNIIYYLLITDNVYNYIVFREYIYISNK